jgi:S-adenosylmethionine synthetase
MLANVRPSASVVVVYTRALIVTVIVPGRGNRVDGFGRPMSLEAAAGKNPVAHVGKLYNVVARDVHESIVASNPSIAGARCSMVG